MDKTLRCNSCGDYIPIQQFEDHFKDYHTWD